MIKVIFKNLEKSDLVRQVTTEKIEKTINKFSELAEGATTVIVSREHSHEHSGLDLFSAKLLVEGHGRKPFILEKRAQSLYQAVALVTDRALEVLHKTFRKDREKRRYKNRQWKASQRWI